jgi:prepilin-type N-terminal cleavage/methylation domain-containing protein
VIRRLLRRARLRDDAGMSLVEIMVAMGIMSVVMVTATAGLAQIYHSVNESQNTAEAQAQVTRAFERLDQEIRYARGISTPATLDGDYYVEYLVAPNDVDTCVELRLRTSCSAGSGSRTPPHSRPPRGRHWPRSSSPRPACRSPPCR